jgi:SAM-dependent methyltransferase
MDIDTDEFNRVNYAHIRDANNLIDIVIDENGYKFDIVVDVGCGSGNVTTLLNQRISCEKLVALDVDTKMIKFAKTHYPAANVAYVEQDIGVEWNDLDPKLKDLEGKVSLIFSNRVLHWVEDKKNAAKNLYRLLSPTGKIYTTVTTLWDLFHDLVPEEKNKIDKILKIPTEEEQIETWRKAFTESGFHNIEIEFFILRQLYPSDEFKNVLLPYFPNLTKKYLIEKDPFKRNKIMTSGFRETIKNAIMRLHCRELPNGEDGKPEYELAYGQCRVVATK